MKIQAFSDIGRHLYSISASNALKEMQTKLSQELASGQTIDPVSHLKGDLTTLAYMTRRGELVDQFLMTNSETELFLKSTQSAIGAIEASTSSLVESLLIVPQSRLSQSSEYLAMEAENALSSVVAALNTSSAGRYLFSGLATDTSPLVSASDLKLQVYTALSGATSVSDVSARLDAFFSVGGDFEANAFQGSDETMNPVKISETSSISFDIKADDSAFRDLLKAVFLALASEDLPGFSRIERDDLIENAKSIALTSQEKLFSKSASLGFEQEHLEKTRVFMEAEKSGIDIVKADLLSVDAYETASRLEEVNLQLEFLYTVTARSRNMSFLEYMR